MKKISFIAFILLFDFRFVFSQSLNEAAEKYKNGDYKQALEIYQKLNDGENPYLIYNIGNCHYKMGDKTTALSQYIKAFKILPRDARIKENMLKAAGDNGEILFSKEIPDFAYSVYYFFSDNELSALFELFFAIFVFLIVTNTKRKDNSLMSYIVISAFLFSIFGVWHMMRKNSIFHNPGVIAQETDVLSGPKNNFNTLATVPKGRVVTVLSENDDYFEIGIPKDNIKGWVKKEDLIKID